MKFAKRLWTHVAAFPTLYLALGCMIFTIVVYYPGYMSPDSVVMLGMARTGVVTNVYSPLMSYVWRVCDWIIPGPGGMLILQSGVYWISLAVIAGYATANRLLGCLLVLTGLWIPNFAMLGINARQARTHPIKLISKLRAQSASERSSKEAEFPRPRLLTRISGARPQIAST